MKYLSYEERKIIEKMLRYEKASYRSIGKILSRSHTTIQDEIRRNQGHREFYDAEDAQRLFLRRQLNKGNKSKIENNEILRSFIFEKLREDWSPNAIAGRLKRFHKKEIGHVCHETIYKFLYSQENRPQRFFLLLHHRKPKRRKQYSRKKRSSIPERVSIHKRSQIVNNKARFGDWETDSVIFSKQKEILSVQVERKTKLLRIHICKDKSAMETKEALMKTFDEFPIHDTHTLTFDNGTENVLHTEIRDTFELDTYFCDPYSSHQKGLVEHSNMLLRRYLPRHTNLSAISRTQLLQIQERINNRPRKSLNYLSPNEFYKLFS